MFVEEDGRAQEITKLLSRVTEHFEQKRLDKLPEDVILYLFSFCDLQTLGRLCCVSKSLFILVHKKCVWVRVRRRLTAVGSSYFRQNEDLSPKEHCRIAVNWQRANCYDCQLVRHNEKQLPWIQMEDSCLWISYTNTIGCYKPKPNGFLQKLSAKTLRCDDDDVCRFTCKDGYLVSGSRDGSISVFSTVSCERLVHYTQCHVGDTQCVDFHSDIVVSGSRDASVKIWRITETSQSDALLHTFNIVDRVWSLALDPTGRTLVVGNSAIHNIQPLHVFDVERLCLLGSLGSSYKRGAGVLDVQFENPNVLLTCGYDTYIRLWDLRCSYAKSALCWEEPCDSALYCVQSDYNNAFLTGSSRHGMIHLWDKRKPKRIQTYYVGRTTSPVFSLVFSHSHMYVALDKGINMLDFGIYLPR